jgi:hypothetical protein
MFVHLLIELTQTSLLLMCEEAHDASRRHFCSESRIERTEVIGLRINFLGHLFALLWQAGARDPVQNLTCEIVDDIARPSLFDASRNPSIHWCTKSLRTRKCRWHLKHFVDFPEIICLLLLGDFRMYVRAQY